MVLNRVRTGIIALFVVGIILAYAILLVVKNKITGHQKLTQANLCSYEDGTSVSVTQNQNKAYFVSCGGFIE